MEVGAAGGDGEQGAAGVFCGHVGCEVGRGFVRGLGLLGAPFHEEAVGQPGEKAMHPDRVAIFQAALIVAAGVIQPGVESVFNPPVVPVAFQPARGGEFRGCKASDLRHGFGCPAIDFAAQAGGLLRRDPGRADHSGFGAAFVAFVPTGQSR